MMRSSERQPRSIRGLIAHEQAMARDLAELDVSADPQEAVALLRLYRHVLAVIEEAVVSRWDVSADRDAFDAVAVRSSQRGRPDPPVREVVLDVLIDLEAVFPIAMQRLDPASEERLRAHIAARAAR